MQRYRLSIHTYACAGAEGAVFLDLRRGAYIGIDPLQSRALSSQVEGWLRADELSPSEVADAQAFAESLRERGLLASAPEGRSAAAPLLEQATSELIAWKDMPCGGIRHLREFVRAEFVARTLLACSSLHKIVTRHQARLAAALSKGTTFDLEKARQLVSAYYHLRLWSTSPKGACLLDSIRLLEFLSRYALYPRWVIGVHVQPFSAHSWLQHGHCVLNGQVMYVRSFSPLLVI